MQLKKSLAASIVALAAVLGTSPAIAQTNQPASATKDANKQDRKTGGGFTDGWITMKVHSQFVPEDALEDSDIDVDTTNGIVTLSGTVPTEAGRARAVAIAKATDGVKSVSDKLKVMPAADRPTGTSAREAGREATGAAKTGGRRVNDGWIKSKIYSQFLTEDALEDSDIDIAVRDGQVTLKGTVASEAGRSRAVAVAKATDGVKKVDESLRVGKQ
jgi:hyperosmotically inducible periplasmic protein